MIVLDTDVISEALKLSPDLIFVASMRQLDMSDTYVTSLSIAEIRAGIELMPQGRRRDFLEVQTNLLFDRDFEGRVIGFDTRAAFEYGEIAGKIGEALIIELTIDAQIGAIARARGAAVATRNIKHFKLFDVPLINPWDA